MFYDKRGIRTATTLSITHLARLEEAGKFPKRVKLTDAPNGRVGWVREEVERWVAERVSKRDSK
jgi:prophage regulatory protein